MANRTAPLPQPAWAAEFEDATDWRSDPDTFHRAMFDEWGCALPPCPRCEGTGTHWAFGQAGFVPLGPCGVCRGNGIARPH